MDVERRDLVDFTEQVRSWGADVVDSYLETWGRNDNARSVKSSIEEATGEYGGRFFVELLQNAHDAHPGDRGDGRVQIVLDETEGPHGTVYAADAGSGFAHGDFRAISNLALSNKPVGEGIGNKGVGFKSVLQVCESPEIYSCDPEDRRRDGFCFRFADPDDLRAMTKTDEDLAHVLEDVSRYTVPVPLHEVPAPVRALRDAGFSSVFRLPLRSRIAAVEAARLFEQLGGATVPVTLFLTRITSVTLVRRNASGTATQSLERRFEPVPLVDGAPKAELVTVGQGRTFLLVSRELDRKRLKAVLREAVKAELLKPKWLKWDAPAHVAIAVPYGWEEPDSRLYTYLPMGEGARAPLHGHLHAPFFTDYSRKGLEWEHPLNSMLLDAAGELAVDAAACLLSLAGAAEPAGGGRTRAAVDLVSWEPDRTAHLPDGFVCRPAVPGLGGEPVSVRDAWLWPEEEWDVLSPQLAQHAAGLALLELDLGEGRLARLRQTAASLGECIDLPAERLAAAVEAMAARCFEDGLPYDQWDLLYDDIAVMFEDPGHARELAGRRLLLAADGGLRECATLPAAWAPASQTPGVKGRTGGGRRTRRAGTGAAFFQPVRQRTDDEDEVDPDVDLELPGNLRSRLFFLHPELTWHDENRQPTRARELFRNNRLVRKFDARSLVDHLRAVLAETASRRAHAEALRFLFDLQRSRPSTSLPLQDSNVRLPAADGELVAASSALFSRDWPGTRGADLHAVASAPAETAAGLAELRGRLLAAPDTILKPSDDRHAWTTFLRRLGVLDTLPVHRVRDTRELYGHRLRPGDLSAAPGVPDGVARMWAAVLPASLGAQHTQTEYKTGGSVTWLPGQDNFDDLPGALRHAYARLLLAGLEIWPDEFLTVTWERDRQGYKDPRSVPTPLKVFLSGASWLPVHDPVSKLNTVARPGDAWHFQAGSDAEPPRFAPIVARAFRQQIDTAPTALGRLRSAGMGVWNASADGGRLTSHLAGMFAQQRIDQVFVPHLANAYRNAWVDALEQEAGTWPAEDDSLIVRCGADLVSVRLSELGPERPVVVTDEDDDEFLRRVAADFQMWVLHLAGGAERARDRIASRAPGAAARPAELDVQVQFDGADFAPDDERPALVTALPWLHALLILVLAHRGPAHERSGEAKLRLFTERLGRVRLATAGSVAIRIGETVRPTPPRLRGVMPVPHPHHPTLTIELKGGATLAWEHIEAAAEPLMQLLGLPRMATEAKLAITRLLRTNVQLHDAIPWTDLADACDVDHEVAQLTLAHLGSGLQATLQRLHPVLVHLWGPDVAQLYAPPSEIGTDEQLDQAVVASAARVGVTAAEADGLVNAARQAATLDALRAELGIELADINSVLAELDPPQPLIDYGAQHAEAFELAVLEHASVLHDRIRWARLDLHRTFAAVPGWPALRELSTLRPDPAWSHTMNRLSDADVIAEAERQLATRLGGELPAQGLPLQPIAELRSRNRTTAETVLLRAAPIVHAWCQKNRDSVPEALADPSDVRPALSLLDDVGALDFDPLEPADVFAWARVVGAWPRMMALTADPGDLGLAAADLEAAQSEEEKARQRKQQERRTVEVDGTKVDVGTGFAGLRNLLQESLNNSPGFLGTAARNSRLGPPPPTGGRRGGGERPSGPTGPARRASDQQLNAIGFAGEWLAYHWLLTRYPNQVNESCWKSKNRAETFTGDPGRDDLGYDFAVPFTGGPIMYEVKATTGDGGEIQLGESEVLTAQDHSRNNRWRLLVVTNVMTADRQIRQLRNPFRPESRGEFAIAGQGLRLLYHPL